MVAISGRKLMRIGAARRAISGHKLMRTGAAREKSVGERASKEVGDSISECPRRLRRPPFFGCPHRRPHHVATSRGRGSGFKNVVTKVEFSVTKLSFRDARINKWGGGARETPVGAKRSVLSIHTYTRPLPSTVEMWSAREQSIRRFPFPGSPYRTTPTPELVRTGPRAGRGAHSHPRGPPEGPSPAPR